MTREEEITNAALEECAEQILDCKWAFMHGAKWADEHPKQLEIRLSDIESAEDIFSKDWQETQKHLFEMMERHIRQELINKACEWLENFCNEHYIMSYSDCNEVVTKELMEIFIKKMKE